MKSLSLLLLSILALPAFLHAQDVPERASIHRIESERHRNDTSASSTGSLLRQTGRGSRSLSARVFGYHPYWSAAGAYLLYDYTALSTIGYFSYEVDPATGGYSTVRDWRSTPLIDHAHARGVKVALVVTNFGYEANDMILSTVASQQTLIDSLISLLRARNGDGVNIDFEQVRGAQRANLVSFMIRLATQVRAAIPGAEISMATPAVDWNNAFDIAALAEICDYLLLMGYDYHWSTAPTAGPVAPLVGESQNVTRSVETYLATGMPPAKLLLAVPWYGYDWPTVDSSRGATTTGSGRATYYADAKVMAESVGRRFDETTKNPWYVYTSRNVPRQTWYDDSLSLALKYAMAKEKGLGGIGIWALGYEKGAPEIWNGITAAFGVPSSVAADAGGSGQSGFRPNPTTGAGSIAIESDRALDGTLMVIDILGRMVLRSDVRIDGGTTRIPIDLRQLAPGVYHYRIRAGESEWQGGIRVVR